jgi:ABC-type microcin C transport system permease subunit YejB
VRILVSIVARVFAILVVVFLIIQLARSGAYGSVDDIKRRLKAEGYGSANITGPTLLKQLRMLIKTARDQG